ncbi:MAG: hypothetical protein ABIS06_16765 [Vicinamibacterales bacterium]
MSTLLVVALAGGTAQAQDPAVAEIVKRVGDYVAAYGEKTSAIVGTEKYSQLVTFEGQPPISPRQLLAEFAIVRAGSGWTVSATSSKSTATRSKNGETASKSSLRSRQVQRRNLGVPTAGLFFFQPANLARFTFTKKGNKKINGIDTVELEFKETRRPTMVMRRSGADVPMEGTLWVVPADGTVVRTRLKMKNFADAMALPGQQAPALGTVVNDKVPTGAVRGSSSALDAMSARDLETDAEIEVTYTNNSELGLWLPSDMSEQYQGPVFGFTRAPTEGRASTKASYTGFKKFGTGAAIKK